MRRKGQPKGADRITAADTLRQIKLRQTAEYTRELEVDIAELKGGLSQWEKSSDSQALEKLSRTTVLAAFARLIRRMGSMPSQVMRDIDRASAAQGELTREYIASRLRLIEEFNAAPANSKFSLSPDKRRGLYIAVARLYLDVCEVILRWFREYRGLIEEEIQLTIVPQTPRESDQRQRDKIIKKLRRRNPAMTPVEIYELAKNDPAMQAILSRNKVRLSKDIVRNILKPLGKNKRKKTEARAYGAKS